MKCQQRLCQRTKNLKQNGNCNVCEEAIAASTKTIENYQEKVIETVETDLKLMISTHNKLLKGETVEKDVVSVLLLGGVINILSQHNTIHEMENKVKSIEFENVTNKCRLESLENWVLKQDKVIKELDEKLLRLDKNGVVIEENTEIANLRKKVVGIELDISSIKNTRQEKLAKSAANSHKPLKCDECSESFVKACELEMHVEDEHKKEKPFECNICDKKFHLSWRLKKHKLIHSEKAKFCHYFNNAKYCPFDAIGCMFRHEKSGKCNFETCNNKLCQFEHLEVEKNVDNNVVIINEVDEMDQDEENDTDDVQYGENDCHLCDMTFTYLEELCEHFRTSHQEYYKNTQKNVAQYSSTLNI